MYKIKLCPFCGAPPYLEEHSRGFVNGETTRVAYVHCTECNGRGPKFNVKDYGCSSWSKQASSDAVDAWNSRIEGDETINFYDENERKRYRKLKQEQNALENMMNEKAAVDGRFC